MSINFGRRYTCPKCKQQTMFKTFAERYYDESDVEHCSSRTCDHYEDLPTKFNKAYGNKKEMKKQFYIRKNKLTKMIQTMEGGA